MANFEKIAQDNEQNKAKPKLKNNTDLLKKYSEYNDLIKSSKDKLSKLKDDVQQKILGADSELDDKLKDEKTSDVEIEVAIDSTKGIIEEELNKQVSDNSKPSDNAKIPESSGNIQKLSSQEFPEDKRSEKKIQKSIKSKIKEFKKLLNMEVNMNKVKGLKGEVSTEDMKELINEITNSYTEALNNIDKQLDNKNNQFVYLDGSTINFDNNKNKLQYIESRLNMIDATNLDKSYWTAWSKGKMAGFGGVIIGGLVVLGGGKWAYRRYVKLRAVGGFLKGAWSLVSGPVRGAIKGMENKGWISKTENLVLSERQAFISEIQSIVEANGYNRDGKLDPKTIEKLERLEKIKNSNDLEGMKNFDETIGRIFGEHSEGIKILKDIPVIRSIPGIGPVGKRNPGLKATLDILDGYKQKLNGRTWGFEKVSDDIINEIKTQIELIYPKGNPIRNRIEKYISSISKSKTVTNADFLGNIESILNKEASIVIAPTSTKVDKIKKMKKFEASNPPYEWKADFENIRKLIDKSSTLTPQQKGEMLVKIDEYETKITRDGFKYSGDYKFAQRIIREKLGTIWQDLPKGARHISRKTNSQLLTEEFDKMQVAEHTKSVSKKTVKIEGEEFSFVEADLDLKKTNIENKLYNLKTEQEKLEGLKNEKAEIISRNIELTKSLTPSNGRSPSTEIISIFTEQINTNKTRLAQIEGEILTSQRKINLIINGIKRIKIGEVKVKIEPKWLSEDVSKILLNIFKHLK